MSETGDRVDDPSRPRDETSDHPSGMIRQPALRARGKYVSKSDMVTDALRELITDRQLSPGTPLRQRDLAEQFDVSYTPVREALRRLESEGLVVTDVHRGATVARTESQEMELTAATAATVATAKGGGDSDEPVRHCDSIWCWQRRPRQFAYCPAWQYSPPEARW
jgi:DNA-binding transcriptional regulator YhcF (GntR family)